MTADRQTEVIQGFRLSPAQARLWSIDRQSGVYRAQCAMSIEGEPDARALKSALERVAARHEILRTTFPRLPGLKMPLQVVSEAVNLRWSDIDLCAIGPRDRDSEADRIISEQGRAPIDVEGGPVLAATLVRLSPAHFILLIDLPSLCADSASLEIMMSEVGRAYEGQGEGAQSYEEPAQYAQFSEWQHELLEDENAAEGRAYWEEQDFSPLSSISLPFEEKSDSTRFDPHGLALDMGDEVAAKLERLALRCNTSLATLMMACWQILLCRMTGQDELVVGCAMDGRKYDELRGALGPFTRWIPIRTRLDRNYTLAELLRQIERAHGEACIWQEYFTWAAEAKAGVDSSMRFFSVGYEYEARPNTQSVGGALFSVYRQSSCIERFKLKLTCIKTSESLVAEFGYDRTLIAPEAINRLAGHFNALVENVLANSDLPVGAFSLLGEDERHRLLVELNDTRADYPGNSCIHDLIERQAAQAPRDVAVATAGRVMTYAELDEKSNQLARYLQGLGVGPEVKVAICLEPSLEMIVGIVGVLKAGASYVPLDPAYPFERLAFMLEDTQAPVLLTRGDRAKEIGIDAVKVISLDSDWEAISDGGAQLPERLAVPENIAYVIYTSGSTGKPKGVQVTHRNLVHSTSARLNYYTGSVGCYLLLSSFAFDSSVAGIFWTLCQGGTLLLPEEGAQRDLPHIARLIARHQVSHLLCLPSLYALLLEQADLRQLGSLRAVIVAGEACPKELTARHRDKLPGASLFNEYGPTEATVWASVYECDARPLAGPVPIGRPVRNMRIYLLDEGLDPAPVYLPGELYIGGEGLARGYLNRPDLTAERFIPNPFSLAPGDRLYRTGDQARYLSDGQIEFLGRIDQQVKIRGYRIEPGEIEAALADHPSVRDKAVIAREDAGGEMRLVAYIVLNGGDAPTAEDLRRHLQQRMPDYMVPAAFVTLDALPVTPNGKLDRHALPPPEQAAPERKSAFVQPQTQMEEVVARIWVDVLGIEQVGIHDNFFDLGGHSFLAIKVHNRLCRHLNRDDIPLLKLFEHTTVQAMAKFIGGGPKPDAPDDRQSEDWADRRKQYLKQQRRGRRG